MLGWWLRFLGWPHLMHSFILEPNPEAMEGSVLKSGAFPGHRPACSGCQPGLVSCPSAAPEPGPLQEAEGRSGHSPGG